MARKKKKAQLPNAIPCKDPEKMFKRVPNEIWDLIGKQLGSCRAILRLVMVCRCLRNALLPLLYRRYVFKVSSYLSTYPKPIHFAHAGIKYTRHLEVDVQIEHSRIGGLGGRHSFKRAKAHISDRLSEIVISMESLQSFSWIDRSGQATGFPLTPELLEILISKTKATKETTEKSAEKPTEKPGLSGVLLQCPDDSYSGHSWFDEGGSELLCRSSNMYIEFPDIHGRLFRGLQNLTALEIYNLRGKFEALTSELAPVLLACPQLQILGLGMAWQWDSLRAERRKERTSFFELLCKGYSELLRQKFPIVDINENLLDLRVLRLGFHIARVELAQGTSSAESTTISASYLGLLTKTSSLEKLHLFNDKYRGYVSVYSDFDRRTFIWPEIPQICPKIRQVAVCNLTVLGWLNHQAQSVSELILVNIYHHNDNEAIVSEMKDAPSNLRLPRLSLLYVQDIPPYVRQTSDRIRWPVISEFLYDRGRFLTRLGVSIHFDTAQWDKFLESVRDDMKELTHLHLEPMQSDRGIARGDAMMMYKKVSKEETLMWARMLFRISRTLQAVMIGNYAWRRNQGLWPFTERGPKFPTRLEQMTLDQINAVELFSISRRPYLSGMVSYNEAFIN